jgi:hypothetical protein
MGIQKVIQVAERVYGYFAPTRYLQVLVCLLPSDVNKFSFYVSRPHLPAGAFNNGILLSPFFKKNTIYSQTVVLITKSFDAPQIHSTLRLLGEALPWISYWCEDWIHSSNYRSGVSHIFIQDRILSCLLGWKIYSSVMKSTKNHRTYVEGNVDFTNRLELYH